MYAFRYSSRHHILSQPIIPDGYDNKILPPSMDMSAISNTPIVDSNVPENGMKNIDAQYNQNAWLVLPNTMRQQHLRERSHSKLRSVSIFNYITYYLYIIMYIIHCILYYTAPKNQKVENG